MSKKHYKLYKSGKQWLTIGITIASLAFGITMATDAQADVVAQDNATSTTQVAQSQQTVESATVAASYASTNSSTASASNNVVSAQPATINNFSTNVASQASQTTSVAQNGLVKENGNTYYYNNNAKVTNEWEQVNNNWYYFGNEGNAQTGWYQSQAGFWYYFNNETAQAETGWQKINNNWYHFDETNANASTGWYQSNAGFWYYFDQSNAWAEKGWQKINNNWYYFDDTNANALTGWQKINNVWYHFDESNAWANTGWYKSNAGFWYYFDNNNANALTGWQKLNNAWYYFDNVNAFAWTNWHLINGSWYFFDLANAWADTGYHIINGIEYYFDPVNANLYQNRWVNVNGWTYHADNSGRLWFPQWYSQFRPYGVAEGCSIFSLAMLLSPKEYINFPYACQLLQARQSGNIYTGVGFSLIIQPDSLVELAHHFDSSVRNISGSSVQDIINIINSGHPVEYYGFSAYERTYWHRNHAKVIVGYQNGWFRVFDPCYSYTNEGSAGMNAFDYGAKSWITTAQFAREYAGQAITVD